MALPDPAAFEATLMTERLRIEPIAARHAPLLYDGMREPAVYEWISMEPPASVEALAQRWAANIPRLRGATDCWAPAWAVQRRADGAWIGALDAEVLPGGIASNVGYFFFPAYWGRGLASEAVRALCDHLACHGVVEQRATVTYGNLASERVLQRAGFTRTRVLVANDTVRGVPVDDVEYVRRDPGP
jgi:ribosomal-protein-alanine N-acetyltransferase